MPADLLPCPFCGGAAHFERLGTGRQSCIVACEECGARLESSESGASSGAAWNARDPDTRAEGINAGLALVSEWLDAAGVPRGPKGHGVAETVQARIAGLAGSPPSAEAAPGKADQPADDDIAAWREWGAQSIDPEAIERLAEEGRDPGADQPESEEKP